MEAKKNPSKDVHRMSGMFFQIGLGLSLIIIITAFEWRTEVKRVTFRTVDEQPSELMLIVPNTIHREPAPPLPIKPDELLPPSISISSTSSLLTSIPDNQQSDEPIALETDGPIGGTILPADDIEICEDCFTSFPEKQAEPIGGYEGFYKKMSNELRYPKQAVRYAVEGKVFVEFIVDRHGNPVELKVIRGIGFGLDEEAMRVISLSKWNPGKQRGKPVRVKMMMTIAFKLN